MEPKLGKMLILGAILNCLDPVLTIVAGLSVRDPFLTPLDKKDVSVCPFLMPLRIMVNIIAKKGLISLPFTFFLLLPYSYQWVDMLVKRSYLTMLPLEPKLAKMLLLGAIINRLDPVLTIVAGLNVRDLFLTPIG